MGKIVSVVGAGVAGLASAIRLQNEGYIVTLYEKESLPGGKMNQIKKDGFTFDVGPSIVMMPEIFKEVFEIAGRNPDDYIPMTRLDPMYSAYFENERIDVSSDLVKIIDQLEGISEEDASGFLAYLKDIYDRFLVAKKYFIERPFRHASDFYNP
ncbi:MAG: NAD(P)-binding protein, partial [Alkalibacterium sp.]|nr:NAD(P)-binding protein [Alkalibacterium sp.]